MQRAKKGGCRTLQFSLRDVDEDLAIVDSRNEFAGVIGCLGEALMVGLPRCCGTW